MISWIFIIFADARTTVSDNDRFVLLLWLAEFLLSLLMQEQQLSTPLNISTVVISWIFIIFADARTTNALTVYTMILLWLAEFLLSLLMQEQHDLAIVEPEDCCD